MSKLNVIDIGKNALSVVSEEVVKRNSIKIKNDNAKEKA